MANLSEPKTGTLVTIKGRPVRFSYWPTYRTSRRFGLHSLLFATNPWAVINGSIDKRCPVASKDEAKASLIQAEYFFNAQSSTSINASKALLAYYCFLNLAKSYMLTIGQQTAFDQAQHGISEKLKSPFRELQDAHLEAYPSPNSQGKLNIFAEFHKAIHGTGILSKSDFELPALLPQLVMGHRLWCEATDSNERFIAIEDIEFIEDESAKSVWLRFYIFDDDLSRHGITHERLLTESGLASYYKQVKSDREINGRPLLRFEQISPVQYTGRPADVMHMLVKTLKNSLWTVVTSIPPYRRYYLYLAPAAEQRYILPQIISVYAVLYYLGSITRYRPHHFNSIMSGDFGAQIQEILSNQPNQMVFLLASEFAEQEITRPAVV